MAKKRKKRLPRVVPTRSQPGMAPSDASVPGIPTPPVRVTAVATEAEAAAQARAHRFPPPLVDLAKEPTGFYFYWRLLEYAFDINDPAAFPPLTSFGTDDKKVLQRYAAKARELARSTLLSGDGQVTVRLDDATGDEHVEASFTEDEPLRGFLLLFRQFCANDERASFQNAMRILQIAARSATDSEAQARIDELARWGKAAGVLRNRSARRAANERMAAEGIGPAIYVDEPNPEQVISTYLYGDHVHWGEEGATELAEWDEDPFTAATNKMHFLQAVAGLAYLYMGFGVLVSAALGDGSGDAPAS
jgi:hypothetical protein